MGNCSSMTELFDLGRSSTLHLVRSPLTQRWIYPPYFTFTRSLPMNSSDMSLSSSSSCRTARTDLLDPLSPPVSIAYRSREVFKATSCIGTELFYIGSCRSSCLCSSMWKGSQEYIAYEFVLTSPAVSRMSGSSNVDNFRDGWCSCDVYLASM